jgi:hypothetical protein
VSLIVRRRGCIDLGLPSEGAFEGFRVGGAQPTEQSFCFLALNSRLASVSIQSHAYAAQPIMRATASRRAQRPKRQPPRDRVAPRRLFGTTGFDVYTPQSAKAWTENVLPPGKPEVDTLTCHVAPIGFE